MRPIVSIHTDPHIHYPSTHSLELSPFDYWIQKPLTLAHGPLLVGLGEEAVVAGAGVRDQVGVHIHACIGTQDGPRYEGLCASCEGGRRERGRVTRELRPLMSWLDDEAYRG